MVTATVETEKKVVAVKGDYIRLVGNQIEVHAPGKFVRKELTEQQAHLWKNRLLRLAR